MLLSFVIFGLSLLPIGAEPLSLLSRHPLLCPACGQEFTTLVCVQHNTRGGIDYDLFVRPLGPNPEYYRVHTCPRCGYSGYASDFPPEAHLPNRDKPFLSATVREKILKQRLLELPEGFGPESDPRELDARDRYRLAIQCYQWRDQSAEALAWLNLRASWIARDEGALLPPTPRLKRVMSFIEQWRPFLEEGGNQVDVEMQLTTRMAEEIAAGRFNRYQKPYVELALAMILRSHGENQPAKAILKRYVNMESYPETLQAGIARMLDSIETERQYQQAAVDCFETALSAGQVGDANRPAACYLLGELHRRLGQNESARQWYDKSLNDPSTPPDLKEMARRQIDLLHNAKGGQ